MPDVTVPAGPYAANSVFDANSVVGYTATLAATWSPSGNALSVGADGIPYMVSPASGRQSATYFETDGLGVYVSVPGAGDGHTATYWINDAIPVLGTIPTQVWSAGVDSYADLDIADPDDGLATLVITGTLPAGVSVVLHTYLPGDPGEFKKWRLEFSLGFGAGNASGTISDLVVTDPQTASATFAAFNWARVDGVQVPVVGTITYADYVALLVAAGLSATQAILVASTEPDGNVLSTNPAYPAYVLAGTLIEVTVSLNPVVAIPVVRDLTPLEAIVQLTAAGLVLGAQTSDYSDQTLVGLIASQNPPAGTSVVLGTEVDIVVSLGPLPFVPPEANLRRRRVVTLRDFLTG